MITQGNSLPTISQNNLNWEVLQTAFEASGVKLDAVLLFTQALIQINSSGGFGSIKVSILGNRIQEIKTEQTRRADILIMNDSEVKKD